LPLLPYSRHARPELRSDLTPSVATSTMGKAVRSHPRWRPLSRIV